MSSSGLVCLLPITSSSCISHLTKSYSTSQVIPLSCLSIKKDGFTSHAFTSATCFLG
uniref:Uncharacterized protein n=1 Tax=uncultured marine virus TaxID=186617 RepID=A0A0F7L7K4_9VIRU|nr:hypothetical protein [uncultured marine virus]